MRAAGLRRVGEKLLLGIEPCIEALGVDRCMFESNFPVDKGQRSYPSCGTPSACWTANAGVAEKVALYSGTAMRTYGLDRLPAALAVDLQAK